MGALAAGTRISSRWSEVSGEGLGAVCPLAVVFSVLNLLISVLIKLFVFICSTSKSCAATEKVSLVVGGGWVHNQALNS